MTITEQQLGKKILDEMYFDSASFYSNPAIIVLSGMAGSGKTLLAKEICKDLNIFLLSQDYLRVMYCRNVLDYSEENRLLIDSFVKKYNIKRLLKLLRHRVSFLLDCDLNDKRYYEILKILVLLFRYDLIKIRIHSNDDDNIRRISARNTLNFNYNYCGDNSNYDTTYSAKDYYDIKERKRVNLDGINFDYELFNTSTKEDYLKNIKEVSLEIEKRLLKKETKGFLHQNL